MEQTDLFHVVGQTDFLQHPLYEKGEREPVASVLIRMANYYGVTIDYLVGRTDRRD